MSLGSLSACDDGGSDGDARLRLFNVSTGYNSLDLYTAGEDASSDSLTLSAVTYGSISNYASLNAGTYTIKLKRNGVTSTLQTLGGANLAEDTDRTYLAFGSTGKFGVMQIGEDYDAPSNGYTSVQVQVFNTSEAGALDVYLTEPTDDLEDASPVVSGIPSGGSSSLTTVERGTYRLRVTGSGDTDDIRLDIPEIELANQAVLAIVFTATPGGVLVNAITLPQGGSPTTYANTKVRLRGAVGISNGTRVTARVGGVSVLSSSALGVVGNYAQIEAGTAAVPLAVDGIPVTAPDVTLTAGGEYTLLVWSNVGGTQTTLIVDDNRLPDSDKAKIRVINGISVLGVPITLSVNYSPIVEGVDLGQGSVYEQVDPSSEYQFDVFDSNTAATLYNRSSVSLQAGNIYTLFLSSSGGGAVGTLRNDR
jgi:hypothetical protein